jgi:hypothetical protein
MKHERAYYRWLVRNYVLDSYREPDGYACVVEQMYRKAYYYTVRYDENRAEDGLELRNIYLDRHPNSEVPQGPCSFLEFLIGVSVRLSEMLTDGEPIPVSEYFWELARRIQLTEYTDDMYADGSTPFVVDAIMTDLMDRNYDRCGSTGLFPLRRPCKNQKNVEIWYQLNAYLLQNPQFFEE